MSPILDFVLRASLLMVVGLVAWRLARHRTAESRCSLLQVTFLSLGILPLALFLVPKWQPTLPWAAKPEAIVIDPILFSAAQGLVSEPQTQFPWALAGWIAVGLLVMVPALMGWWSLRRIWRMSERPNADLSLELIKALSTLGIRKAVRVRLGDVKTPLVFGIRYPHVLLPTGFGDWPETHRRSALMHEAAHIRRFDCAWLAFAGVVRAIYACHPLVWWLSRALRDETELAADERAIRSGVEATDYASALVAIARDLQRPGRLVHSQGVTFMNHRQLDRRVRGALASRRRGFTLFGTLGLLGSALATVLGISAVQPKMPEQEFYLAQSGQAAPPVFEETAADLYGPLDRTVQVAQAKTKGKAKPAQKLKPAVAAKPKAKTAKSPQPGTYVYGYSIDTGKGSQGVYQLRLVPGTATTVAPISRARPARASVTTAPTRIVEGIPMSLTVAPIATQPGHYQVVPGVLAPAAQAGSAAQPAAIAPRAALPARSIAPVAGTAPTPYSTTLPQGATAPKNTREGVPVLGKIPLLGHYFAAPGQSADDTKRAREIVEKLLQGAKGKPEEEDLKRLLELISKARAESAPKVVEGVSLASARKAYELAAVGSRLEVLNRAKLERTYSETARTLAVGQSLNNLKLETRRNLELNKALATTELARAMTMKTGLTGVQQLRAGQALNAQVVNLNNGIIEIVITDEKGKKQIIKVRQDQVKKTITLQRGKDGKIRVIDK